MTTDFLPEIDSIKCIGCELCVHACPNQALVLLNNVAIIANPDACNYSGVCQEICPTEAISLTYEIIFGVDTRRDMTGQALNGASFY